MTLRLAETADTPLWQQLRSWVNHLARQPSASVRAISERELRTTLPWLLFVTAIGTVAADGTAYLTNSTSEAMQLLVLGNFVFLLLSVYWIRVPVRRINLLFVAGYTYLALAIVVPAIALNRPMDLIQLGVLSMGAFYLILDTGVLATTFAIGLTVLAYAIWRLDAGFIATDNFWVMCAIWAAGLLVHIGRRNSLSHLDETTRALKEEARLRERAEQQSQVAKKRQELAAMVGGVAHDFNNLLLGITGGIELARLDEKLSPATKSALDIAQDSSQAAQDLCASLLEHSKTKDTAPATLKLAELVHSAIRHIELMGNSQCRIEAQTDNAKVVGDFGQLRQVLINLVDNATQAAKSKVRLTTGSCTMDGQAWVTIAVEDDGQGIDPDARGRIFDPFFSTRTEGKGLGLTTVSTAVNAHGGQVLVEQSVFGGAKFVVMLPNPEDMQGANGAHSIPAADINPPKSLHSLLAKVFDDLPFLVFYKDTNNRHLRVNSTVGKLRGIPVDQIEGKSSRVWHPDEADSYYKDDQEVICAGAPKLGIREQIEIAPGKKFWFLTDKYPTFADNQEVNGILVICKLEDVSDEPKLRAIIDD